MKHESQTPPAGPPAPPKGSRTRSVLRILLAAVAALVLGVFLLIPATLLLEPLRKPVLDLVSAQISKGMRGELKIIHARPTFSGVKDARVVMLSDSGKQLLLAAGVEADVELGKLIRSLFSGDPLQVNVNEVSAQYVDVDLSVDGEGELFLALAFGSEKASTAPSDPPPSIEINEIRIEHAWVHGEGLPLALDAELNDVLAEFEMKGGLNLTLEHARIATRDLAPNANLDGKIAGAFSLPPPAQHDASAAKPAAKPSLAEQLHELEQQLRPMQARLTYDGDVGTSQVELNVETSDGKLNARLVASQKAGQVIPLTTRKLQSHAELHLSVEGPPDDIAGKLRLESGKTNLALTFSGRCDEVCQVKASTTEAQLEVDSFTAQDMGLLQFSASVEARALDSMEQLDAKFRASFEATHYEGIRIPPLALEGYVNDGVLAARAKIHEPGLPTTLSLELPLELDSTARFEVRALADAMENSQHVEHALKRLGQTRTPRARGQVHAAGTYDFPAETLNADVLVALRDLNYGALKVDRVRLTGSVEGRLSDLYADAALSIGGLTAGDTRVKQAKVYAKGRPPNLELRFAAVASLADPQDLRLFRGRADVSSLSPSELSDVRLSANESLRLEIDRLKFDSEQAFEVDGLRVTGAGTLNASADVTPARQSVNVSAESFSIGRLMAELGLELPVQGMVDGDVEFVSTRFEKVQKGNIDLSLKDIRLEEHPPLNATLTFEVTGNELSGIVKAQLDRAARLRAAFTAVDSSALLRSRTLAAAAENFSGELHVDGQVQLEQLNELSELPLHASGTLLVESTLKGVSGGAYPDILVNLETEDLSVRRSIETDSIGPIEVARLEETPWEISGLDASVGFRSHPDTPHSTFVVELMGEQQLALATLDAELDIPALLRKPDAYAKTLPERPFNLGVLIRDTQLEDLPGNFIPGGLDAELGATVAAKGTIANPAVVARIKLGKLTTRFARESLPLTLITELDYDGERLAAKTLGTFEGEDVVQIEAQLELPSLNDADGSAFVEFTDLPLGCLPLVRDYAASGMLGGKATLKLSPGKSLSNIALSISNLEVRDVEFEQLMLNVNASRTGAAATLRTRQEEGAASIEANVDWNWQGFLPEDPRLVRASLTAKDFDIKPLLVFVNDAVSTLEGRLSGTLQADTADGPLVTSGSLQLRGGAIQIPAIGQRFERISADLRLREQGKIVVSNVSGRGYSGRFSAEGEGQVDRKGLQQLSVAVEIPKRGPLPLTLQGVALGDVWGKVRAEVRRNDGALDTVILIPELHVLAPAAPNFSIQDLEPAQDIHFGVFASPDRFLSYGFSAQEQEPKKQTTQPATLTIRLGEDVWLQQGRQARVSVNGDIKVWATEPPRVQGAIEVGYGEIDVLGKKFVVESGTIRFDGPEPSNPTIDATARWEAPAGYSVYAEYRGPAKSGKMTLRAEPPLTQSQILNLILFDTPEGAGGDAGEGGNVAGGVASTIASTGISEGLSDLTNLEITAGVDTGDSDAPRPEVGVRISPTLSVELQYNPGQLSLAETPDRALVTLDWRFAHSWSLATTIGDHGTTMMDVVWTRRY